MFYLIIIHEVVINVDKVCTSFEIVEELFLQSNLHWYAWYILWIHTFGRRLS